MNLYNTTEDVIEQRFNGFMIVIGPGGTKAVSDDAGRFMMQKCMVMGLVSLDYGEKEEERYGSLAKFKESKKMEGLVNYKNWLTHNSNQDSEAERENTAKHGGKVEAAHSRQTYFKNKIKEVEALMKQTEPEVKVEAKEVKAEKKPGRPRKVINVNEETVTG
jgi:hypothetical protein